MFGKQFGKVHHQPYISIIIVAYNTGDELIECLRSLSTQTTNNFECIVVDNSCEDLTKLEQFNITYFQLDKNYGPSFARNFGVEHARGEVMAFLDDDAIARNDFAEVLIRTFRDPSIVAVRGKVLSKTKGNIYNYLPENYDLGDSAVDTMLTTEGNSAVRKSDFVNIKGFDISLYGHEGISLSYKLRNHGRQFYIPELVIYHDYGDSLKHFLSKQYRHGYNYGLFSHLYPQIHIYKNNFKNLRNKDKKYSSLGIRLQIQLLMIKFLSLAALISGIMTYKIRIVLLHGEREKHLK